ncbi:MAG: pilus assembly PilX N-terminal domain-containing protein [bacterium]
MPLQNNSKGFSMALTMMIALFMLTIGTALIYMTVLENKFVTKQKLSDAAFYIAEGGIHKAMSELHINEVFDGDNNPPLSFGNGEFETFITTYTITGATVYRIVSTGAIPNFNNPKAKRRIQVDVGRFFVAFDFIAFAESEAKFNDHGTPFIDRVDGPVRSNGANNKDVLIKGTNVQIFGDVTAVNKIKFSNGAGIASVVGALTENAEYLPFPIVDLGYFKNAAQNNWTYYPNTAAWDAAFPTFMTSPNEYYLNGVIYVEGDINFDVPGATITVEGTLVTEDGEIFLKDFARYQHTYQDPANPMSVLPAMISAGKDSGNDNCGIDIDKGPTSISGLIYCSNINTGNNDTGEFVAKTSQLLEPVHIFGSQTCYKIHDDNNFHLKYDPNVKFVEGFVGGEIRILEWTEVAP